MEHCAAYRRKTLLHENQAKSGLLIKPKNNLLIQDPY